MKTNHLIFLSAFLCVTCFITRVAAEKKLNHHLLRTDGYYTSDSRDWYLPRDTHDRAVAIRIMQMIDGFDEKTDSIHHKTPPADCSPSGTIPQLGNPWAQYLVFSNPSGGVATSTNCRDSARINTLVSNLHRLSKSAMTARDHGSVCTIENIALTEPNMISFSVYVRDQLRFYNSGYLFRDSMVLLQMVPSWSYVQPGMVEKRTFRFVRFAD